MAFPWQEKELGALAHTELIKISIFYKISIYLYVYLSTTIKHSHYEAFHSQAHQTGFLNSGRRRVTWERSGRYYPAVQFKEKRSQKSLLEICFISFRENSDILPGQPEFEQKILSGEVVSEALGSPPPLAGGSGAVETWPELSCKSVKNL